MTEKASTKSKSESGADELLQSIKGLEAVSKGSKKKILDISEISLILDNYDDIFSDFDPRPYAHRSLSEDFLLESKKASRDKDSEHLELRFLIPKKLRNTSTEAMIKRRLRGYFQRNFRDVKSEIRKSRVMGVKKLLAGASIGALAAYLSFHDRNLPVAAILIVLQPASWFTMWMGLDDLFNISEKKKSKLSFYEKMSHCQISFIPY
jgi:hypothetical protein